MSGNSKASDITSNPEAVACLVGAGGSLYDFASQYPLGTDGLEHIGVLHKDFVLQSTEAHAQYRQYFRAAFGTQYTDAFVKYVVGHAATQPNEVTNVFITASADSIAASAIFNLGDQAKAGQANDTASLKPEKTEEFKALENLLNDGEQLAPTDLVEFLEDWAAHYKAFKYAELDDKDSDDLEAPATQIKLRRAIHNLRNIKVAVKQETTTAQEDLRVSSNDYAEREASSTTGDLPEFLTLTTSIYDSLPPQTIKLRIVVSYVQSGEKQKAFFTLKPVALQAHKAAAAKHFASLLQTQLADINSKIHIGSLGKVG